MLLATARFVITTIQRKFLYFFVFFFPKVPRSIWLQDRMKFILGMTQGGVCCGEKILNSKISGASCREWDRDNDCDGQRGLPEERSTSAQDSSSIGPPILDLWESQGRSKFRLGFAVTALGVHSVTCRTYSYFLVFFSNRNRVHEWIDTWSYQSADTHDAVSI